MPWTINDKKAEFHASLTSSAERVYDQWHDMIDNDGTHPKTAAELVGDTDFETYGGGKFTIRLSGGHRVYFEIDETNEEVTVKKVGTHKSPRSW